MLPSFLSCCNVQHVYIPFPPTFRTFLLICIFHNVHNPYSTTYASPPYPHQVFSLLIYLFFAFWHLIRKNSTRHMKNFSSVQ